MPGFDLDLYLKRIAYTGPLEVDFATVSALQKAHLLTVPFENLDIHLGQPIVLELDSIFDKVVSRNRGGFCYELNGLFFELLTGLGFAVERISARVFNPAGGLGPKHDHQAVLVHLPEGDFLADVGFGEFAFAPLKVGATEPQADARGIYLMQAYDLEGAAAWAIYKQHEAILEPEYVFTTTPYQWPDFNAMCLFHSTASASHFSKKPMISRPVEGGRITLSGNALKISQGNEVQETEVVDGEAFDLALETHFGLVLSPGFSGRF